MVLAQINELKLRQALLKTALAYLETHPLDNQTVTPQQRHWRHKLKDMLQWDDISLLMCRVVKLAEDEGIDKSVLAVVAGVLFHRFYQNTEIRIPLTDYFLQNNPFEHDLLEITSHMLVHQEHLATCHKFDINDRENPELYHYYQAFLYLFITAAEENSKQFDAAIVEYLKSHDILARLNII